MVLDGLKFYCNLSVFEQFQYKVVLFPKDTIWILLNLLWILLTETVRNTIKDFQKYRTRQGSSAKKKKRFKKTPVLATIQTREFSEGGIHPAFMSSGLSWREKPQ